MFFAMVWALVDIEFFELGVGIKLSSFVFSYAAILLLFSARIMVFYMRIARSGITKLILKFGQNSFGIYLIHCFFIEILFRIYPCNNWPLRWGLVAGLSLLFITETKKIIPNLSKRYLGFR